MTAEERAARIAAALQANDTAAYLVWEDRMERMLDVVASHEDYEP